MISYKEKSYCHDTINTSVAHLRRIFNTWIYNGLQYPEVEVILPHMKNTLAL